jgi:hypothetical protein
MTLAVDLLAIAHVVGRGTEVGDMSRHIAIMYKEGLFPVCREASTGTRRIRPSGRQRVGAKRRPVDDYGRLHRLKSVSTRTGRVLICFRQGAAKEGTAPEGGFGSWAANQIP